MDNGRENNILLVSIKDSFRHRCIGLVTWQIRESRLSACACRRAVASDAEMLFARAIKTNRRVLRKRTVFCVNHSSATRAAVPRMNVYTAAAAANDMKMDRVRVTERSSKRVIKRVDSPPLNLRSSIVQSKTPGHIGLALDQIPSPDKQVSRCNILVGRACSGNESCSHFDPQDP